MEEKDLQQQIFEESIREELNNQIIRDSDSQPTQTSSLLLYYRFLDIILPHYEQKLKSLENQIEKFQITLLLTIKRQLSESVLENIKNGRIENMPALEKILEIQIQRLKNPLIPHLIKIVKQELRKKEVIDEIASMTLEKGVDYSIKNSINVSDLQSLMGMGAKELFRRRQLDDLYKIL